MTALATVQAALDGLLALAKANVGEGVVVTDGPPAGTVPKTYVAIGVGGSEGEAAVTQSASVLGLARGRDLQEGSIACQASSWAGSGTIKTVRDRTFAIVSALEAAINADRRLGGAVMSAHLATVDYAPTKVKPGPTVVVNFTVTYSARQR